MSIVAEVFGDTGEYVERPMTAAEAEQRKADEAAAAAAQAKQEAQAQAAASARLKIADASGLTPEEMAALGL